MDTYLESKSLDYVGLGFQENYIWTAQTMLSVYVVQSSNVSVFLQRFIDLSSFSFFNFGQTFVTYEAEKNPQQTVVPQKSALFTVMVI